MFSRVKKLLPLASPKRLYMWWKNISTQRQDRIIHFSTLLAVLLFVLATAVIIVYLRLQEVNAEQQALERDAKYARQQLSVRMNQQFDTLQHAARGIALWGLDGGAALKKLSQQLAQQAPEIREMMWLNPQGRILESRNSSGRAQYFASQHAPSLSNADARALFNIAKAKQQPVYGAWQRSVSHAPGGVLLMIPTQTRHILQGYLYVRYSQSALLHHAIPEDIQQRHVLSLYDSIYAGVTSNIQDDAPWWKLQWILPKRVADSVPVTLHHGRLWLHLQAYQTNAALHSRALLGAILLLSILITWILLGNWLHLRKRIRVQQNLRTETNFRRAMENSMITGMRALDLTAGITYVNAAFCGMTGFTESELLGQTPPFSYWHPEDVERNHASLENTLKQKTPQGGYEMRVMRKNGSVFDARMYVSPLVGTDGQQIGWISSTTDITESNRFKHQLSASYERFGRVLDALDIAVSVAPLGGTELLFANQSYRQWFGSDAIAGHLNMLALASSPYLQNTPSNTLGRFNNANNEIYIETIERWVEVRSRYLHWRDGVIAQLVIATDITVRKAAQALSEQHEQQAQAAGRLVTMGEMASSFAHELNQPLTAIHNYCNGMRDRITHGNMPPKDLLQALEKTAKQAQRAGTIIQRIREFVKRSAPNYVPTLVQQMVSDAVDLAGIEMSRRFIRFGLDIQSQVESIMADRILIEQVLVNLMKNAAEAIDSANMPSQRRNIQLTVDDFTVDGKAVLRFSVRDSGLGLCETTLTQIFDAFFTTKQEGLGIGLNLCRSIVEAHQGRLYAENLYNTHTKDVVGCCFVFWLPAQLSH